MANMDFSVLVQSASETVENWSKTKNYGFRMEIGDFDDLVDDQSEFKSRERCDRCIRPVKVCLCAHIGFVTKFTVKLRSPNFPNSTVEFIMKLVNIYAEKVRFLLHIIIQPSDVSGDFSLIFYEIIFMHALMLCV